MEDIRQALTCGICMELVNLSVHATCCDSAKSSTPACLGCVRSYLQLNSKPEDRFTSVKSWAGCGCNISTQHGASVYAHANQLDMVRNTLGPSYCHHEKCKASFSTCSELRRHLKGTSKPSDTNGNCKEAMMNCPICGFFGKRGIVEGEHYTKMHAKSYCHVCGSDVAKVTFEAHLRDHQDHVKQMKIQIDTINRGLTLCRRDQDFCL